MGIALACLWISHYVLGFASPLADNIATNVIGLALGTAFRFTLYRFWVFRGPAPALHPSGGTETGVVIPADSTP